jgi:hypothetical protein
MPRKPRKQAKSTALNLYRLTGDDVSIDKRAPSDDVALSWATGVLCRANGDEWGDPENPEAPIGDYTLSFVGENRVEPIWLMRKDAKRTVSWCGA